MFNNVSLEDLLEYKRAYNLLCTLNKNGGLKPASTELIKALAERWTRTIEQSRQMLKHAKGENVVLPEIEDILSYKAYNQPCGCMGPRGDDPLCYCEMNSATEDYRFDIAVYLKASHVD